MRSEPQPTERKDVRTAQHPMRTCQKFGDCFTHHTHTRSSIQLLISRFIQFVHLTSYASGFKYMQCNHIHSRSIQSHEHNLIQTILKQVHSFHFCSASKSAATTPAGPRSNLDEGQSTRRRISVNFGKISLAFVLDGKRCF